MVVFGRFVGSLVALLMAVCWGVSFASGSQCSALVSSNITYTEQKTCSSSCSCTSGTQPCYLKCPSGNTCNDLTCNPSGACLIEVRALFRSYFLLIEYNNNKKQTNKQTNNNLLRLQCSGTCSGTITCPTDGSDCTIRCLGNNACNTATVYCSGGSNAKCEVDCSNTNACQNTQVTKRKETKTKTKRTSTTSTTSNIKHQTSTSTSTPTDTNIK